MEIAAQPELQIDESERCAGFARSLLEEACQAVTRNMETYDYQVARLIRKVSIALSKNPAWAGDEEYLLGLIRAAATGFGGRRKRVWLASFDSSLDATPPPGDRERNPARA